MRPLLLHPTHGVSTPQAANIHFIQSSTSQNQYSRSTMIFSLGESAGGASEKRMELLMHCFFLLPDPGLIYISPVWSFQIHLQDLLDVTLALEDRSMQSDPKWCPLFPPLILSKWHLLDFTNNLNNVHFKYWFLTLTNYALNMCFTAQRYLHLTTNQKACLFLHRQQTGIENVW